MKHARCTFHNLPTCRYGASTKAAVIRIGLLEMWRFISCHFNGKDMSTLLESCGVADLIATCSGGRNRRVSEAFVKTGKVSSVITIYVHVPRTRKEERGHASHTVFLTEGGEPGISHPKFKFPHQVFADFCHNIRTCITFSPQEHHVPYLVISKIMILYEILTHTRYDTARFKTCQQDMLNLDSVHGNNVKLCKDVHVYAHTHTHKRSYTILRTLLLVLYA